MKALPAVVFALGMVAGCSLAHEVVGDASAALHSSYGTTGGQHTNMTAPHNEVMHIGWNTDDQGNPDTAGEPSLRDSWESNWLSGGVRRMERHWQYTGSDGTTHRRPLSMIVDRSTHETTLLTAGKLVMMDQSESIARVTLQQASPSSMGRVDMGTSATGTLVYFAQNNAAALQQRGVTGQTVDLVRCDYTDAVVIGGSKATAAKFQTAAGIVASVSEDGLRLPTLTETERDATSPTAGTLIFNTTAARAEVFNGSDWAAL